MRRITLHDTRSGEQKPLEPRDQGRVSMYACGPTVYGRIHVGNARPYVVFSLLKRFLAHEGYDVTFVANVTDVNDKIYDAARAAGVPSEQLAREMTAAYMADTEALGLGRPDHEPLASETIGEIVALIGTLIDRGHAYAVDGDVYFDVRSYPAYGELSHRHVDDMDQGEGIEGATLKRDPLDFALWKAQKEGEDTAWDAPWGRGRPGWHIECSAMAETLLGVGFDIHGGGSDLVFPHHENEAAQTAAARGAPLTRLWVHNGMVRLEGEKMAKSVGNIFLLHEAIAVQGRDALIAYFCAGHYRQPIAYSEERLAEAARSVERIRDAGRRLVPGASPPELAALREAFFDALADDFNTPKALAVVFDWVREANRRGEREQVGDSDLREMLGIFALERLLDADAAAAGPDTAAQELLAAREAARAARDFATADRLRDELAALGWEVRDSAAGATLRPARLMVLYGRNAIHEALRGPRAVEQVWATERAAREPWLRGAAVRTAAAEEIERRCGSTDHQGICAEVAPYRYADAATLLAREDALIVALDEIQDPQNLGAICRTAECAGATGVVMPERRSAEVTPAVCKASAGAVEHLAIAQVRNLADFLLDARRAGAWSYGADGEARVGYAQPDYRGKVVLVMGSEGSGLRPRVARSCDELIALPLRGRIESLNVSAAAAALLYEITRQRA